MLLKEFFDVLRSGRELTNAETWKRRQVAINSLVVLITAGLAIAGSYGHEFPLDERQIADLATGIYGLVGVFNALATLATTSRIGLPSKPGDQPAGGDDGGRFPDPERFPERPVRIPDADDVDEDYVPYLNDHYRG